MKVNLRSMKSLTTSKMKMN